MVIPSFEDNFWGDRDEGFDVLYNRMRIGKQSCVDVVEVIAARALIEDEYSKKLLKLARSTVGKDETGTMKSALDELRTEMEFCANTHATLAVELKSKCEKPLADFVNEQSVRRKNQGKQVQRTHRLKRDHEAAVQRNRKSYESRCKEAEALAEQVGRGGAAHKDAEKLGQKHRKAVQAAEAADREYQLSVEKLKTAHAAWESDMRTTGEMYQKLEEERLTQLRSTLWEVTNALSSACVVDDQSHERVRGALEKCNIEDDLTQFVETSGTGTTPPACLSYEPYGGSIGGPAGGYQASSAAPAAERGNASVTRATSAQPTTAAPSKPQPAASNGLFEVKVLYDYDPQGEEELSLQEGDMVTVVSTSEDPWWEGTVGGRTGMFPSNFVERV